MERSQDDGTDQEPPEDAKNDVSEFVEVDPTGRYGRVWPFQSFQSKSSFLKYNTKIFTRVKKHFWCYMELLKLFYWLKSLNPQLSLICSFVNFLCAV